MVSTPMFRPTPLRPAALLSGVLLLGALTACGDADARTDAGSDPSTAGGYPVGLANCGVDVEVTRPIERAVAVNQPALELLLALGLGDRMTGYAISDDSVLPELEEERAKVKPFAAEFPSFESVLDRDPDFLYTTFDYTFTDEGIADRERFTGLGVPTYQSPSECAGQEAEVKKALTLQDQYDEITDVARLFGVEDKGAALVADLQDRAAAAKPADGADEVTLAWWYAATKSPYIAGCCGAPGLMTRAVGATNAFEESDQYWPEIGWESILDKDPTVLVLADLGRGGDGDSAKAKIAFLESDPVASRLTAVKEKRYIILDGTTMDPSIRNVDGIEQLAAGLRKLGLAS
ncbi:ABC transporter substrate-binding protein [Nocardioides sp. WV_118_6]|uniref:ABC transporter substrate-binding protein n=1 Tax=Nocardioides simplex TaxID=2045 RepID=UPI00214FB45A|nr:ABC transporter substrate-binding protein [Pimelobacter simplex]UUW88794.1 ABC transporter substrate-binding protein [Pimelobacter simplex]UUW98299.1 ABC transporter substrate-binding protein [Pimelobacter simplex]